MASKRPKRTLNESIEDKEEQLYLLDKKGVNADYSIQLDVTNQMMDTIAVSNADGRVSTIMPGNGIHFRDSLIIALTVRYNRNRVNIDVDNNCFDPSTSDLKESLAGHCRTFFKDQSIGQGTYKQYTTWFVVPYAHFEEMGHVIRIKEIKVEIRGNIAVKGLRSERFNTGVSAHADGQISGIVFAVTDNKWEVEKLFYAIGTKVMEAQISRDSTDDCGFDGRLFGKISKINGERIEKSAVDFSLEEALSGENPLGIKFHTSREAVTREVEEIKAARKLLKPEKDEDKEKSAKLASAWIKAGGEFIKSILPTMLKAGKWLLSFLTKKAVLGTAAAAALL